MAEAGQPSVAALLAARVGEGALAPDPAQEAAARALDAVLAGIRQNQPASKSSALGWLFAKGRDKQAAPRGLYLHGGVGRGKTMLMDMFFAAVPVAAKRRVHFNDFMADTHDRIARHRAARKAGETHEDDPIPPVAKALARDAWVLCFDEFSVTDIADAMILSRLFSALFAEGIVLVATSNVAPENLYKDGLNRPLFEPFVTLLERRCAVLALDGPKDYRLERLKGLPVYLTPLGPEADRAMDAAWEAATAGQTVRRADLAVMGRTLSVSRATNDAARFSFAELCEKPLGARDYLAVADRFNTLFIDNVPAMGETMRNEAKRFILLIDTLYNRQIRLFLSAAVPPSGLYRGKTGNEAFEFARTASRLIEMQGEEWLKVWRERRRKARALAPANVSN